MKYEFLDFNYEEDDLVRIEQQSDDTFSIVLKEDLHLLPYTIFIHDSEIKATPISPTYRVFGFPCEEPVPTYIMNIRNLIDEAYKLSFYLYSITGKEIVIHKDSEIGYLMVTKSLVKEMDHAFYKNEYLLIKELKPNTIKKTKYIMNPDGSHSLTLDLNVHFLENPFELDMYSDDQQNDPK